VWPPWLPVDRFQAGALVLPQMVPPVLVNRMGACPIASIAHTPPPQEAVLTLMTPPIMVKIPTKENQSNTSGKAGGLKFVNRSKRLVYGPPNGGCCSYTSLNSYICSSRLSSVSCSWIYFLITSSFHSTVDDIARE
jgi:hypothetical protein